MTLGTARIIQGDATHLPLEDESVDLCVTSPPYFGLRSYTDACPDCADTARARNRGYMQRYCPQCARVFDSGRNKCHVCNVTTLRTDATKAANATTDCTTCGGTGRGHYDGQLGDEPTPREYVNNLITATTEMIRVLKPTGSIWVNLGDKYSGAGRGNNQSSTLNNTDAMMTSRLEASNRRQHVGLETAPAKSLIGIPWRYALRCVDDLGLILRAEIIWSKPNGLPESVTDRVRRSHEVWFHFTKQPRYYSAIDHIREPSVTGDRVMFQSTRGKSRGMPLRGPSDLDSRLLANNPLGKLPGSVWEIPTQPLTIPDHLGVDHYAAFPIEWPRRIIQAWSPPGICTACRQGRRPTTDREPMQWRPGPKAGKYELDGTTRKVVSGTMLSAAATTITGYACDCPTPTAPTTPAIVLDPFGGTGTTALAAKALGRTGITLDMSADYNRIARWRTNDPGQLASALQVDKPAIQHDGQLDLLDGIIG